MANNRIHLFNVSHKMLPHIQNIFVWVSCKVHSRDCVWMRSALIELPTAIIWISRILHIHSAWHGCASDNECIKYPELNVYTKYWISIGEKKIAPAWGWTNKILWLMCTVTIIKWIIVTIYCVEKSKHWYYFGIKMAVNDTTTLRVIRTVFLKV